MKSLLYPLLILSSTLVPALAADGWVTDFEAAKKQAAEQKKDLLIDFTGSDWCGWCIRLKSEVFDQDAFKKGVADKFVLVELDFPKDKSSLDAKTIKQNEELAKTYAVEGYPTILLTDALGRPYGQTGYLEGGPGPYLENLEKLRTLRVARDEALAKAEKLEGIEKAKVLAGLLADFPDDTIDQFYSGVAKQVLEADPKDETGFKKGRDYRKAVGEYEKQVEALFVLQRYADAIAQADSFLAAHDPMGEDKQHILMAKVMAYAELHNEEKALETLEDIRKAAPDSEIAGDVDRLRDRIGIYIAEKKANPTPPPTIVPAPSEGQK